MVNRDADLSATTVGNTTYFVVPEPLANDWANYCKSHPGFSPTGETGSHVKWDYTEWLGSTRIADEAIEYLCQLLVMMEGE